MIQKQELRQKYISYRLNRIKGDKDRYQINTCETEAEIGTDIR